MNTLTELQRAYIAERVGVGAFTGRTPSQVRYRLAGFSASFGKRPLSQLTEKAIHRYLATIADRSQATRSAYLSTVRRFCVWLHRHGAISTDPTQNIDPVPRPRRVPRALGHDSITACLEACRDERDRAVIMLAVGCGLRRAEIAGLRWCDFDDQSRTLFVKGKASNERMVPVPAEVYAALAPIRSAQSAPIIARQAGAPGCLSPFTIWDIVNRVLKDAGVKMASGDGRSTHSLRHTCASDVLDQSGDLRVVQQMLGHADLKTTSIYLRVANLGDVRSAMEGRDYGHAMPDAA